jgi:RHS repeat-associated protein
VGLREKRPDERARFALLRAEARLVGLHMRVDANLRECGFPERRADVCSKKHQIVHRAAREGNARPTHRFLDAIDRGRVGALVDGKLGEKRRTIGASFAYPLWCGASRVVQLARAATHLDDVNAALESAGIVVTRTPDGFGRLGTVTLPTGTLTYTYSPTTGQLTSIAGPATGVDAETIGFGYDGSLRTDLTYSGAVAGTVHWSYNADFRMSQETVNSGSIANFVYDNDGLLTNAGSLTLTSSAVHGLLSGTTLGNINDSYTPDTFGALLSHSASFGSTALFLESITLRDALGRIKTKTETVQGTSHTYEYTYDVPGRLTDVKIDGVNSSHYEYDANGNRTRGVTPSGTALGTSDNQDRLLSYGSAAYQYTANGELLSKTVGSQVTNYTYDALGNLKHVGLPGGPAIDYLVDGLGQRVGKRLNGTLVKGFVWIDELRIAAQLDGAGNVVSRFVYGSRPNVPEYMIKAGAADCSAAANLPNCYRLVTDHLGSVRLVVKVSDGSIAQRIDYDEFGVVTSDSSPGFQPFGFAGGLYDPETKLVRLGARDYDSQVGRWTTKDPINFQGGDANIYVYVRNDPINRSDPRGLYGTDNCSYYDQRCQETGSPYYCGAAKGVCERAPKGRPGENPDSPQGVLTDWSQCVRECLQDCDKGAQIARNNRRMACGVPPSENDIVHESFGFCHAGCFLACAVGGGNPF